MNYWRTAYGSIADHNSRLMREMLAQWDVAQQAIKDMNAPGLADSQKLAIAKTALDRIASDTYTSE